MTDLAQQEYTHNGATLVWDSFGDRDSKQAFVLLHGLGLGRSVFDELGPRLSVHGLVIRVDLPGFGDSPVLRRGESVQETARLLLGLLDQQGVEHAVLIGHSMGTQLAVEASIQRPNAARALVLIAPVIDPAARSSSVLFRRMVRDMYDDSAKVLMKGLWLYCRAGVPMYFRKLRMMLAYRMDLALPHVTVPVLIVRGQTDLVSPVQWCTDAAALARDGRLVEIAGYGHETFINDSEPTALAIEGFLREIGLAGV